MNEMWSHWKEEKIENEVFLNNEKTINDNIQNNEDTKDEVIRKEKTDTEAK